MSYLEIHKIPSIYLILVTTETNGPTLVGAYFFIAGTGTNARICC